MAATGPDATSSLERARMEEGVTVLDVNEDGLAKVRTPVEGLAGVTIDRDRPLVRDGHGHLVTATLVGPDARDPSQVERGIWDAMGRSRAPRTLAQLSNIVPPTPQLYEKAWRGRSLSLLSGRSFPLGEELSELDDALGDVDGAWCVDVGCSEGLYARHLAARGAHVFALDHSRPFLRRAISRADRAGTAITAVRATAQRLPFLDGSLDAVVIGGSMNEIGDRSGALSEAARVLRSGGTMFSMSLVTATTSRGRLLQRVLGPSGIDFPTLAQMNAEFEAVGLQVAHQLVSRVVTRTTLRKP